MKKTILITVIIILSNIIAFAQKDVIKAFEYNQKGAFDKAMRLIDKAAKNPELAEDLNTWYCRSVIYYNLVVTDNEKFKKIAPNALEEANKSLAKFKEINNRNPQKEYTDVIAKISKELAPLNRGVTNNKVNGNNSQESEVQDDENNKTVTLTVIGQGKTKDAAKYNALNNVIERAFGAFISSNTTILNDALVKDEIVSVSNGYIHKFEILSETQMPDGSYSSIVKATVSVTKLASFCENKGIAVEFKGGLFAANIRLQEMNRKNEEIVLSNLYTIIKTIAKKGFDYTITASDPIQSSYSTGYWKVPLIVNATLNKNMDNLSDIIQNTFQGISISASDQVAYKTQNIDMYKIIFNGKSYYFRSMSAEANLRRLTESIIPLKSIDFKISNGISEYAWLDIVDCIRQNNSENSNFGSYIGNCSYISNNKDFISTNYPLLEKQEDGRDVRYKFIEDLLMNYNKTQSENSSITINKWHTTTFKFSQVSDKVISFNFSNFLTTENLSKITEYKVTPIFK